MKHVISWSGGKDSTASIILMHEHEEEIIKQGDEVIILFAEVMFDIKENISGHNPDIIKFIYDKKKIFESWGYKVEILRSDKDFLDVFYHKLSRSTDKTRIGKTYGFPISGLCAVKRDCKLKPIEEWHKENSGSISYVGIAIDEPHRLESLHKQENAVSLLEKYGLTERDAFDLCHKYDMVSPQYYLEGQKRDGCWFCPNAKYCEHKVIKEKMPYAWKKYVALEKIPDLAFPKWNSYSDETLEERDRLLNYMNASD